MKEVLGLCKNDEKRTKNEFVQTKRGIATTTLCCRNGGPGANSVPDPGGHGCPRTRELGEGGSWVICVTLRACTVESGPLVFVQCGTVLDT